MLELRLHQLSVTSNFRTPTEDAVEFTAPMKTARQELRELLDYIDEETRTDVDTTSSNIMELVESWCELICFWPTFFISMCETTAEAAYDILITTDLLGNTMTRQVDSSESH